MLMQLATWQEVEAYLKQSTGIIIPIGSTEQHGPNGLIGTDAICPERIARGVAERLPVLVAPTLNYGMAQHHLAFPGTVSLRPATLIAVVRDVVESLTLHGFDRLYFLNGHGGNIPSITAAFSEVYAAMSFRQSGARPVRLRLRNWWLVPKVTRASRDLFGDAEGRHATPSEVSLTYYAHPEAVKNVPLVPEVAPNGEIHDAQDFRARFPDGRIGSNPGLATVATGERIWHAAVEDVLDDYQAFLKEP